MFITPLERDALRLLAEGKTVSEVSGVLGLSVPELDSQLTRLFAALGTSTDKDAVALARKRGLVTPKPPAAA